MDVGYWLYDVMTKIQPISDVKLTSGACWEGSDNEKGLKCIFGGFKCHLKHEIMYKSRIKHMLSVTVELIPWTERAGLFSLPGCRIGYK